MDLVVEDRVVIELKCVESVIGVHHAAAYLSAAEREALRPAMTLLCLSLCLRVSVVKTQ